MKCCCKCGYTQDSNPKSWVNNSRFIFYLSGLLLLGFIAGACYGLYTYHYKGKPKVEVPTSSLYNPEYK